MNRIANLLVSVPILVAPILLVPSAGTVSAQDQATALDPFLEELFALDLAPGMAIAVVQGDEVVYLRGFGYADAERKRPVTPETSFYIASSTKSFTAMAVSILHQRDELDLDAPISKYLKGATFHADVNPDEITLRDLLTHTHGLSGSGPVSFRVAYSGQHSPELLRELLQHHGPARGGRSFEYSNIGYNVASLVMDDALDRGWKDVLADELFEPLGMDDTTAYASRVPHQRRALPYGEEPDGFALLHDTKGDENMHAAGGVMTTASDLARWLQANLNGGRVDGRQVIPAQAVAAAHRPHAEQNNSYEEFQRTGYGLGWNTGTYDGEEFPHHFGGFAGFHAHVSFMPEHGIGVAVVANTSRMGSVLATIGARYVYDRLRHKPDTEERFRAELGKAKSRIWQLRMAIRSDRSRRAGRSQVLPHPLEAYAGTYSNPVLGEVTFLVRDGKLEMTMGRMWSAVEVYDADGNALRVEPTGSGQVVPFDIPEGAERARSLRFNQMNFLRVDRRD